MKEIQFLCDAQTTLIEEAEYQHYFETLRPEIDRITHAQQTEYDSVYASINVTVDMGMQQEVHTTIERLNRLSPAAIIVIGMGGSVLGTQAIFNGVHGHLYNMTSAECELYFIDSLDPGYVYDVYVIAQTLLDEGETVIINVVTKSGTTTETITNFSLFFELIKEFFPKNYAEYMVVTSGHGSPLIEYAQKHRISYLVIPESVGGRYSVFSPVGLFPLGLIGMDIDGLLSGARHAIETSISTDLNKNFAVRSAIAKYIWYTNGVNINDLFLFSGDLEYFGKWYRQLMAESLGKKHTRDGTVGAIGITPTVSIGSTDLHSVGQLYLGGPRDKLISFVVLDDTFYNTEIKDTQWNTLVPNIAGKTYPEITRAIVDGVLTAYREQKRPYMLIRLPEKNEYYLGQYMQMYMLEVMYLAYLLDVDPFDQPQVELYKSETRKLLAHG